MRKMMVVVMMASCAAQQNEIPSCGQNDDPSICDGGTGGGGTGGDGGGGAGGAGGSACPISCHQTSDCDPCGAGTWTCSHASNPNAVNGACVSLTSLAPVARVAPDENWQTGCDPAIQWCDSGDGQGGGDTWDIPCGGSAGRACWTDWACQVSCGSMGSQCVGAGTDANGPVAGWCIANP